MKVFKSIKSLFDSDSAVGHRFCDSLKNSVSFKEVSADWMEFLKFMKAALLLF